MATVNLKPLAAAGFLLAFLHVQPSAAGTMYRWVDDQGRVHYSDSLPPQFQRSPDQLDKAGRVRVKDRSKSGDSAEDAETLASKRRDKALLSTYVNAKEIDLARDRALELQHLNLNGLDTRLQVQQEKLKRLNALAETRRQSGQPITPGMKAQQEDAQQEIAALMQARQETVKKLEDTKARFATDKARFIELRGDTE